MLLVLLTLIRSIEIWPPPPGNSILKARFRNRKISFHIINMQWDKWLPGKGRPEGETAAAHLVQCNTGGCSQQEKVYCFPQL